MTLIDNPSFIRVLLDRFGPVRVEKDGTKIMRVLTDTDKDIYWLLDKDEIAHIGE